MHYESFDYEVCRISYYYSYGVCKQVGPFATSACCQVILRQFYHPSHRYRQHYSVPGDTPEFTAYYKRKDPIHHKVCPLVQEVKSM